MHFTNNLAQGKEADLAMWRALAKSVPQYLLKQLTKKVAP